MCDPEAYVGAALILDSRGLLEARIPRNIVVSVVAESWKCLTT